VEDSSFWFRHRNRCIVSLVRRFSPDATFLDIGGGNGFVAGGLIESGIACALIEPGIDGALAAHARGIDPVICARLEAAGLRPASAAAAGMFDLIEHIKDELGALRQVNELLATGGRLFLTVPAYSFLFSADDVTAGHYCRYTLHSHRRARPVRIPRRIRLLHVRPVAAHHLRCPDSAEPPAARRGPGTRRLGTCAAWRCGQFDGSHAWCGTQMDRGGPLNPFWRKLSLRGRQGLNDLQDFAMSPAL
jgi:SAM-dependent methyltransferase